MLQIGCIAIQDSEIQGHLKASMIHGYAMPEAIIEVDTIKRTKEGCPDPKWLRAKAASDAAYVPPDNYLETRVQRVIAAFLNLPAGALGCLAMPIAVLPGQLQDTWSTPRPEMSPDSQYA